MARCGDFHLAMDSGRFGKSPKISGRFQRISKLYGMTWISDIPTIPVTIPGILFEILFGVPLMTRETRDSWYLRVSANTSIIDLFFLVSLLNVVFKLEEWDEAMRILMMMMMIIIIMVCSCSLDDFPTIKYSVCTIVFRPAVYTRFLQTIAIKIHEYMFFKCSLNFIRTCIRPCLIWCSFIPIAAPPTCGPVSVWLFPGQTLRLEANIREWSQHVGGNGLILRGS